MRLALVGHGAQTKQKYCGNAPLTDMPGYVVSVSNTPRVRGASLFHTMKTGLARHDRLRQISLHGQALFQLLDHERRQVDSVQSIKKQLKLLEVQPTANPGNSASEPSDGKNRYLAMVESRIDRQWVAPRLLVSNPVVVLKFHISRSGKISKILIAESSGHSHYDSAAQRAVQAVNPLPAFPSDVSDSFFDVQYRFIKD